MCNLHVSSSREFVKVKKLSERKIRMAFIHLLKMPLMVVVLIITYVISVFFKEIYLFQIPKIKKYLKLIAYSTCKL